jgi:hypothetical protein
MITIYRSTYNLFKDYCQRNYKNTIIKFYDTEFTVANKYFNSFTIERRITGIEET